MTNISDSLYNTLEKLPKRAAINLLLEAIDEMQSYNGQSHTSAICRAMGAREIDDENGTHWKIPSINSLKKTFN